MDSKIRKQLELLPSSQAHEEEMTPALIKRIRSLPTLARAWSYAQDLSCLEDKLVCDKLGVDQSQWNKIRKGQFNPPADERFSEYSKVVKNHVVLAWHCESEGFDFLSMRKHYATPADKRVAELEEENAALRRIVESKLRAGQ